MGESRAKSELDQEYREMAAVWLGRVFLKHKLTNQTKYGKALGVDRSTASRYLSTDTRTPLHRLMFLERTLGEKVPQELIDAFWASEPQQTPPPPVDVENEIRQFLDGKSPEEQRAFLDELRSRVGKTGTNG